MPVDFIDSMDVEQVEERYNTSLIVVSSREREVLRLLSQGLTVKEIANILFLSTHTVISHKKNLVEKFNARNSIDLVVKAIKLKFIYIT